MRTGPASVRAVGGLERVEHAVRSLEDERRYGVPTSPRHPDRQDAAVSVPTLAALAKADLRRRYAHGETPAAAEYLDRYPALRAENDRVLSLVYEEFCLREECGEPPSVAEFCQRYADWRDSLASQLR